MAKGQRGRGKPEAPIGRTIVGIRTMTQAELDGRMWCKQCLVIMLDDGSTLYPQSDAEGNGPGVMILDRGRTQEYLLPKEEILTR
jgi:hypothetical protein